MSDGFMPIGENGRRRGRVKSRNARTSRTKPERADVTPYFIHDFGVLYCGDAFAVLRDSIRDHSIDLCVTSPPYFDHNAKERHLDVLGLEPHPDAYEFKLGQIFAQVRRVLKPEGVLWVVVDRFGAGVMHNFMCGPYGWFLHKVLPAKQDGEIYVFAPGVVYKDNLFKLKPWRYTKGELPIPFTDPTTGRAAAFPPFSHGIPRHAIMRCCPEGGTVLDPFMGQGTTIYEAIRAQRRFVGVEIVPELCEYIKLRIGYDTPHDVVEQPGTALSEATTSCAGPERD